MNKAAKLGLAALLVLAGGALAFAGSQPQGYLGAAQIVAQPGAFLGKDVDVKGSVAPGSVAKNATSVVFALVDGDARLPVHWDPAIPLPDAEAGGSVEGKNVVVKGTLLADASGAYLLAREMSVGCPSKYRP